MSFFPALLNLKDKKVLVVGGGNIASFKIEKLLEFTKNITIIAPQINNNTKDMIQKYNLTHIDRVYQKGDIDGFFLVVVAVDSIELQRDIYQEANSKNILCNSVDSLEYCDFIFPSFIKRDDLIIAVSTSGASPSMAKYLRRAIEKILPNSIGDKLKELREIRDTKPKGKERQKLLDKRAKEYIDKIFN